MLPKADHCSFKSLNFVVKCTNVKKRGKYKMLQSVKISELPSADTLTEDDLIVIDQPDDTKKATLFQVLNHLEDSVEQSTLAVLAQPDGFKNVGAVSSFDNLRNVVPSYAGQKIILSAYSEGWNTSLSGIPYGAGNFFAVHGTATDDGGYIAVPRGQTDWYWQREITDNTLNLEDFGCVPDTTRNANGTDCTVGMNACFATAIARGFSVRAHSTGPESRNSTKFYYISAPIKATGINTVIGQLSLKVNSSVFNLSGQKWAIMFGDPATDFTTIQNTLNASVYVYDAGLRAQSMGGIYVKYTRVRGSFRAHYINGSGVRFAPVFDSTVTIWTEVCGSISDYAIDWQGNGDVCNQITVLDLVCHDSYHRGVRLQGNKCNFVRGHIEGTYTLTASDGSTTWMGQTFMDGIQFMNHIIELPASEIGQVNIFDSTKDVTAEGVPTLNTTLGTHTVFAGRRAMHCGSIANTSMLNKTTFVTQAPSTDNPYPSMSVSSFQGHSCYILSSSRVHINNPEIYGKFGTSSSLSKITNGYIEQVINAGGSEYTGVTFNQAYTALANALGTPTFTTCTLTSGIGNLNTGRARFRGCIINGMTLNATTTPEAGEFSDCRFMGVLSISNAYSGTYYKSITFSDCYFDKSVTLPESVNNASIMFLGAGNTKSASAVISNWALPSSAANGTICQSMALPSAGAGDLFRYTTTGWKTIASYT